MNAGAFAPMLARLAWLALAAVSGLAAASELDAAKRDAEAGTRMLEQRQCPALGDRSYLRSLGDPQALTDAAARERQYQESALRQVQQMMADPKLDQRRKANLQALASWSVTASMANWSLIALAQQALASPLIAAGQPYPTVPLEAARDRVRRMADSGAVAADAAAVMHRQAGAIDRCIPVFNAAIFKLNQPQLDAAIDSAAGPQELARLEQLYRMREAVSAGYGAESADRVAARRSAIAEAERQERDRRMAASSAEAARQRALMEQRQAELRARLPAHLAAAQRFAQASQRGDEQGAVAEMAPDIVMVTPQGTYRGVQQVIGAVRSQAASGRGGSLGTPQLVGDRVVSQGSSGQFRITTTFDFNVDSRITRLAISL